MAPEEIEVSDVIPAPPERIYDAWLSSAEHTAMTGGKADVNAVVGQSFSAWDGYIEGVNVELEPGRRILQNWRTTEFPQGSPYSKIEVSLDPDPAGTRITLRHWDIPEGQADSYKSGWSESYFEPMKDYFSGGASDTPFGAEEVEDMDIVEMRDRVVANIGAGADNLKKAAKAAAASISAGADNLKIAVKKAAASVRKATAKRGATKKKPAAKKAAPARGAKKKVAAKSARKPAAARKKAAAKKPAAKKPATRKKARR